ncbi:MAG: hypothetical protein COB15_07880 [Flavobacteriales bacterium]|nr:MAG: hypothetical protein COB15_07880 [Flavobacteriales bacterium]
MKNIYIVLFSLVLGISTCFGQGFKAPADGKAVVYFARVSSMGFMAGFSLFHQEKYIGKVSAGAYVRYECEPGEQLFWASAENRAFVTADLKAGESYIVIVDVNMGAMSARVGLSPVTSESKVFERARKTILRMKPLVGNQKSIAKRGKKLEAKGWIKDKLTHYEANLKGTERVKHLSDEMIVPKDKLKK